MTQDDQQPERAPGGRISRDTLLLLGALTFLILAVALTFLFTPNSGPNEAPSDATEVAQATADAGAYPEPGSPTPASVVDGEPYPNPSAPPPASPAPGEQPVLSPYPIGGSETAPSGSAGIVPTAPGLPLPGVGGSPTAAGPGTIPTGDPSLEQSPTTQGVAGGLQASPSPAVASPTTAGAYPGPVGEGTPPPLPTLNPTVIVPTTPPPPAIPSPAPTSPPIAAQPTVAQPTAAPQPTTPPPPPPDPTQDLSLEPTSAPVEDVPVPTEGPPPPPPADVLRGNVRWSLGQSPIILRRDVQIAPGAELLIEPGVEVRLDPGVSIYVDAGRLLALGLPGQPVRFVGASGARWSGIFGRPGSFVVLENSEVRGGGAGGTVMAVDRSELIIRSSRFNDNGGAILATDTKLEMRDSEVAGNDMPFGPALEASYGRGNFVTMRSNRFGGNRLSDGTPQVRVSNSSTFETLNLDLEGNLIRGGTPNLQLATNGPLRGTVLCNSLVGDGLGFGIRTQTPQVKPNGVPPLELRVENNFIDEHLPPIIPVYLRFGLGRGSTSEVLLDMRNNWWGEDTGPYEPNVNPLGRGDSVGNNIIFAPWLTAPPACAPAR